MKGFTAPRQKQKPSQGNCCDSSVKQVSGAKEVDKEKGKVPKETIHSPGVRREEREVDIPPGERLSIAVACQAK